MVIKLDPTFDRQFDTRLTNAQKNKVLDTLRLFEKEEFNKELRNHALGGKLSGLRSISVDGDLRLHYRPFGVDVVVFVEVGTHKQLYK